MLIPFTTGAAQIYLMFSQNELWETGKYSDYSSRSLGDMRFLNDTIDVFMMLEVVLTKIKPWLYIVKEKSPKLFCERQKISMYSKYIWEFSQTNSFLRSSQVAGKIITLDRFLSITNPED